MQSIKLNTYVGEDGVLQLQIPVDVSNAEMEVIVIYHPTTVDMTLSNPRSLDPDTAIESGWTDEAVAQPKSKRNLK